MSSICTATTKAYQATTANIRTNWARTVKVGGETVLLSRTSDYVLAVNNEGAIGGFKETTKVGIITARPQNGDLQIRWIAKADSKGAVAKANGNRNPFGELSVAARATRKVESSGRSFAPGKIAGF